MNDTEHKCPPNTHSPGPGNRFKIECWDVCFGGRVAGLMDYFDKNGPTTKGNLVTHITFCPFCGATNLTSEK